MFCNFLCRRFAHLSLDLLPGIWYVWCYFKGYYLNISLTICQFQTYPESANQQNQEQKIHIFLIIEFWHDLLNWNNQLCMVSLTSSMKFSFNINLPTKWKKSKKEMDIDFTNIALRLKRRSYLFSFILLMGKLQWLITNVTLLLHYSKKKKPTALCITGLISLMFGFRFCVYVLKTHFFANFLP